MDKAELRRQIYHIGIFNKYQYLSHPGILREIVFHMLPLIWSNTEVIVGLPMGGIIVSTVLSLQTGIPMAYPRKQQKSYGTEAMVEGADIVGKTICIIEDEVISGEHLLAGLEAIKSRCLVVNGAICVIEREGNGREKLQDNGLELRSLFTEEELGTFA